MDCLSILRNNNPYPWTVIIVIKCTFLIEVWSKYVSDDDTMVITYIF